MGRDIIEAVKNGRSAPKSQPPPAPKNGRRRIDRKTERIVNRMKRWRAARAQELELDPGVLCPNSSLEAIAWCDPKAIEDLEPVNELRSWFVREFGAEIVGVIRGDDSSDESPPAAKSPDTDGVGSRGSTDSRGEASDGADGADKQERESRRPHKKRRRRKKK